MKYSQGSPVEDPKANLGAPLLGEPPCVSAEGLDVGQLKEEQRVKYAYRNIAGYACCFLVVLFCLLFFLIPREPVVETSGGISFDSANPFLFHQKMSAFNPNLYELTITGVHTTAFTQYRNDTIDTVFPLLTYGRFASGVDKVLVKPGEWQDFDLYYNFSTINNPAISIQENVQGCCRGTASLIATTGDFSMSTSLHSFAEIDFDIENYSGQCSC
jgi:hypothetical protein